MMSVSPLDRILRGSLFCTGRDPRNDCVPTGCYQCYPFSAADGHSWLDGFLWSRGHSSGQPSGPDPRRCAAQLQVATHPKHVDGAGDGGVAFVLGPSAPVQRSVPVWSTIGRSHRGVL